ncbi:MAG: hypothetical protein CMM60_08420 [Rhodospirillaceae bacterium]|jgi:histidine phosphotransferase ChpT|nr:hypothetical protein [Rhodospirillaceae bacterium]|tara:strand:+ start:2412 stop:3056 length:645 start_codon:yes stop_codon:yes gene_type:complete
MQVDLRVAQLLSSRLCHDLVGPIGAVNTGLELLQEGFDDDGKALGLVADSAGVASRRLSFFRFAFGLGGGDKGKSTLSQARDLAVGFLSGGKVGLDWPGDTDAPLQAPAVKVILNMVLMASESLPRGGAVGIDFAVLDEGLGVAVTATGDDARLREDLRSALAEGAVAEDLTARNVHGYFAQCLARDSGALIEHSRGSDGEIRFAVLFPAATDC